MAIHSPSFDLVIFSETEVKLVRKREGVQCLELVRQRESGVHGARSGLLRKIPGSKDLLSSHITV